MHIVIDARNRQSSTGRYTDRLLEYLQNIDSENRYTILLDAGDTWQPHNNNFSTCLARYRQFSLSVMEQICFAWQLYRLRPDIVHFTMTQQPLLYFGCIVTTTHDLTMLRYTKRGRFPQWYHVIRMALYRFLFWWSHQKSSAIIAPTEFVAGDLAAYQPFTRKKLRIIYEAGEPLISQESTPVSEIKTAYLLHVGSPFPHKNIERLIAAFEIINKKNKKLTLILCGRKEFYFDRLIKTRIANSPAREHIFIPGFVGDSQLRWFYENAECYVLPSLSEGFGLPGLEAMAHDCPLVSSNATCLPEVYGDAASYFDPANAEEMASKIMDVITNRNLRETLVIKGREQLKKYSWRKMAEQTLATYNQASFE